MDIKRRPPRQDKAVEPVQLFDDVYYIGRHGVGVFAVTTSEGIVLIDAMDPVDAAEQHIVPGLEKLGLNPEQIRTILITHGHFDHFAGARHLQDRYDCSVGMGLVDSGFMMYAGCHGDQVKTMEYPHVDYLIEDRKVLRFGNHSFYPVVTPGHTPGCISLIFNCHDNGEEHWVSLWGGSGLPFPKNGVEQQLRDACDYALSAYVFEKECEKWKCDVVLGVHPHRCDLFPKLEKKADGAPNPFIVGMEGVKANLHTRGSEAAGLVQKILDEM